MAELVPIACRGGWRRRLREEEEVAVGVMGPLPRRQGPAHPWVGWLGGNRNGLDPTLSSRYERDHQMILTLGASGKVHPDELLSYITPVLPLDQGDKIDPINSGITSTVNDMARGRREMLFMMLNKKIKENDWKQISKDLAHWPGKIQQLQGEIAELKGRYVRIPAILVTDVALL